MYNFNVSEATTKCIEWIKNFFSENGKDCKAVIGISGGKDSSTVAALCKEAIGKERVLGVLMPNGIQSDIEYAYELCKVLDIEYVVINIKGAYESICQEIEKTMEVSKQTKVNLPARIRMSTLYAVSQSQNGRVINTCNLSEDWVGYSTRYGDSAGDMSPLACFTVSEVKAIAKYLNLPSRLYDKVPSDGLSGKTDEDNLGFTYAVLDQYLRMGTIEDLEVKKRIDHLHQLNKFKVQYMPCFKYDGVDLKVKF